MATGLFSGQGNNAQMTQLLLQKERQDRIQQAGAGMDPLVAAAARATQGMRESVGDIAGGIGGMLTGEGRRLDPRMEASVKLDKDRDEILEKIKEYASDDDINEKEMREGFSLLASRGYMKEAKEFLTMAQNMRKLDLQEKKIKGTNAASAAALAKQADVPTAMFKSIESQIKNKMGWASMFKTDSSGQAVLRTGATLMGKGADDIQEELANHQTAAGTLFVSVKKQKGQAAAMKALEEYIKAIPSSAAAGGGGSAGGALPLPPGFVAR